MGKLKEEMSVKDILIERSEGNPGALTFLMEELNLGDEMRFIVDVSFFDMYEIYGSKLYMFWNDACNRDLDKVKETILLIISNMVPKEKVHENLNRGRALPFKEFLGL